MLKSVFHLCVITINVYTIVYDQYIVMPVPAKLLEVLPLNARCIFLTLWCLVLQTVYYCLALLNDVFGTDARTPKRTPFIRRIKDTLFSLAFPVAIYVSLAFWGIYAVDKDMIFPDHIERMYPKWVNHVMHTTITIFITVELLTSYRNYPSRKTGLAIMSSFNSVYSAWLIVIYMKWGVWVYPIFDHLNWIARVMFILSSLGVALCFYLFAERLNRMVCATPEKNFANGKSH